MSDHHHTHHTAHHHDHSQHDHSHIHHVHETKTGIVVGISAATMVVEITVGYLTNSMALLADGWHMGSHVLALGITWVAYRILRLWRKRGKSEESHSKLLSLSGYTSAIILAVVAVSILVESIERFFESNEIMYHEAIVVSVIGLIVNGISALILKHDHSHGDHNIRAAYLHVLADTLTSVLAITALLIGNWFNLSWLDAVAGAFGALVVLRWSYSLIVISGRDLLEYRNP